MYKITVFFFKLPGNDVVPNITPNLRANSNFIQNVHCYERVTKFLIFDVGVASPSQILN